MSRHFYTETNLFLEYLFFCKRETAPAHWRNDVMLVSYDWSWRSHGSFIHGKFDLKNKSIYGNAVTGMWGSCTFQVMGSCQRQNVVIIIFSSSSLSLRPRILWHFLFVRTNPLHRSVREWNGSVMPNWDQLLTKLTLPWMDGLLGRRQKRGVVLADRTIQSG